MKKINRKVLQDHLDKEHYIKISSTIDSDEENYQGYLVNVSSNFICLLIIEDWHTDGYIVLPIKYITSIRYGKYEKKYNQILLNEGVLNNISNLDWLDLKSFNSFFKSLQMNMNNIIIESRFSEVDEFVIGKIKKIKNKYIYLKGFDGTGKWLKGEFKIPFNEITLIKFGDEYSSVFSKYTTV